MLESKSINLLKNSFKYSDISFLKPHILFESKSNNFNVVIETQRLIIKSFNELDFEHTVLLYGNEKITKYFDHGKPRTRKEVSNLIKKIENNPFCKNKIFGLFSIFLKENMTFIGQIDFIPTKDPQIIELGYIFHEHFHSQGFAMETVTAFTFNYVEELKHRINRSITKIIATVHPNNLSSKKLLEKIGMSLEKKGKRFGYTRLWYSIPI